MTKEHTGVRPGHRLTWVLGAGVLGSTALLGCGDDGTTQGAAAQTTDPTNLAPSPVSSPPAQPALAPTETGTAPQPSSARPDPTRPSSSEPSSAPSSGGNAAVPNSSDPSASGEVGGSGPAQASGEGGSAGSGLGGTSGGEFAGNGPLAGSGGVNLQTGGTTGAGTGGSGGEPSVELAADALFVSASGTPGAAATLEDPTTLADALARVGAGETIYVRAGTYALATTLRLTSTGSAEQPIRLFAYPFDAARPLLDFSAMAESSSNRGLELSGRFWHVYGLDVVGAGDNCMFVGGSNNTIEFSTFSECADTGLQLGNGAADNLVLNCDSYFNADSSLENADGFAAKLDVGSGNRFVGCRAWNNLDDGWDGYLRPADGVTTSYEDCWAIDNGKLADGTVGAGDGNGFKSGGSDGKDLSHHAVYTRCIAAGNVHDGFDHNSNRGRVTILNSAAHGNGSNINFGSSNIAASLTIKNTLSLGENGALEATTTDLENNSWQGGLSVGEDDFLSVDTELLKAPRQPDGGLPEIDYLRLAPGSSLRNAGVDVGLPYNGSAPDIGPFESEE